jgi:hypothetical protein
MCCLHSVCCVDHEERCNLGVRDDTQVSDSELIFLFLILVFFFNYFAAYYTQAMFYLVSVFFP